ncbi:alpha/beta hydrolase family protein [Bythopirellula goksoeyrii]|uniref:4-O-methyl-glucuronoyl methylesterase-like domain-containing protein n=1 Tax=Bythopirellula goksoeyrii TaxID=1400387 RepID=A0A5B9QBD1_9BACT|nr:acetylxylan esterase [Bythopirellula goksoeyrii]QEG34875.1 hypothetical protein Pr1d_21630 [Bythopirellula goksoeyrii]
MSTKSIIFALLVMISIKPAFAEPEDFNYDETKVPSFTLPDLLTLENGDRVSDAETWKNKRRAEIVELLEKHVYGRAPTGESGLHFGEVEIDDNALGGTAVRKQVKLWFDGNDQELVADLLIYLPKHAEGPVPIFLGLNFAGNHAVADDPDIWLPTSWVPDRDNGTVEDNHATDKGRGSQSSRWPIQETLSRGYAVATIYCGDIDPDFDDGFQNGVHALFDNDDQWGTIAAWAWGLSRALDYFEEDSDIDHSRTAVLGHSRLGKAALWAGARDERFALVISNESGCGGAALSRRRFGETVERINTRFPHWFCKNFHKYNDNEDELPVDQHMLCALIAPRPLYIASAEGDLWADPRGEFLSLQYASPVYELLGKNGLSNRDMPAVNEPISTDVAYHIRSGKHDITLYDWQRYLDFADQQLRAR